MIRESVCMHLYVILKNSCWIYCWCSYPTINSWQKEWSPATWHRLLFLEPWHNFWRTRYGWPRRNCTGSRTIEMCSTECIKCSNEKGSMGSTKESLFRWLALFILWFTCPCMIISIGNILICSETKGRSRVNRVNNHFVFIYLEL